MGPQIRVGLTGGIASGKSAVADMLAELGAVVIDADLLARQVVQPGTPGLAAVVARFGPAVQRDDGSLDRAALARIVFADERARADLNAIVHPLVRSEAARLEREAPAGRVVVHVVPLLVETGQADHFDHLVVVDVPEEVQLHRLITRDGLTEEQARARMAAQATRAERLAVADAVIDNSGPLSGSRQQVGDWWGREITGRDAGD